ncbi:uncharacterized protein F5147DRAFT_659407 [Suillus discolor]|uniref:Uncharacterized protein n=1 Tax=Suillus discolor TaxID=1912936 RepID=A0A9P7ER23_9AGAM|nr:uncharacterized protein F5147DRAFT_659407 [Suillus discolor]KAG2085757.1 hypothetical protein F5147DRAFT_659407 [Suillus discolor]
MTSGGSPRKSAGLPKECGKIWKDCPDLDECKKLLEECRKVLEELLEITMRMQTEKRLQGQSPKQSRSGGPQESSGGMSRNSEVFRIRGAELQPREFLPKPKTEEIQEYLQGFIYWRQVQADKLQFR